MSRKKKREGATEQGLFFRVYGFVFGGGLAILSGVGGKALIDSYCEIDSIWICVAIVAICAIGLFLGLVAIGVSILPESSRLRRSIEALDPSGINSEAGCAVMVLAFPIYIVARVVRSILPSDDRD